MRAAFVAAAFAVAVVLPSCVPPPRMCAQESDCGAQASCVAGRCVAHGATPAIDGARRLLYAPVDVGYVERGDGGRDAALATLGRAGEPSLVFLRFSVPLPPEASVLEAYVLLERATSVDADPVPIVLHAARVVTPWDGRTLSWATQPRVEELGAPITRVSPGGGPIVRLDVRDLVQRWRRRGRDELGLAVVTEGESVTGVAFALSPIDGARDRDDP
ncbi:MAG TPA: DNRLRE domain-containing protein, partial [Polyangiaceae bacterium]|nr:DNRLRE domain-containing protein [Polyangiaceae bacterium]